MAKRSKFDPFIDRLIGGNHGRYRRASEESEGGAFDEPDYGPGGSGSQGANQRAVYSSGPDQTASKRASLIRYLTSLQDFDATYFNITRKTPSGKWCPPWMPGELGRPNNAMDWVPHKVPAMPQADALVAGEITAWRAWYWDPYRKRLRSIFVDYEWPYRKPATGEPWNGYGLHSFKTEKLVYGEYIGCIEDLVVGQIAMWGDVVEFEKGYICEFGKVISINKSKERKRDEEIRRLYGIRD